MGAAGGSHRFLDDRTAVWLVAGLLTLHNAEEAVLFPRYLPIALAHLRPLWPGRVLPGTTTAIWAALVVVTVLGVAAAAWVTTSPSSRPARWTLLLVQTTVLLNVVWHVAAAVVIFRGYAPGLATAVALNLPYSIYLLRRAIVEDWVSRPAFWALVPAAAIVHGPALLALLVGTGTLMRGG
jgi:hypothetical protein